MVAYVDDVTLVGPQTEILKALRFLHTTGPHRQFYINLMKTCAFVPSSDAATVATLS